MSSTNPVTVTVEKITPAKASQYLAANQNNRKLRKTVVARYAKDMANGDWHLGTASIAFNGDGGVLDGQHRLAAVVESGVTIESVVVRGVESEAREAIDTGLRRSLKDLLDWKGETSTVALSAAIRKDWRWKNDLIFNQKAGYATASHAELLRHFERNPGLRQGIALGWRLISDLGVPASTTAPFIHRLRLIDRVEAAAFIDEVTSAEHQAKGQPAYAVRNWLLNQRFRRHGEGADTDTKLAYLIKAWNAWVKGEQIMQLSFKRGASQRERFPYLVDTAEDNAPFPLLDQVELEELRAQQADSE